MIQSNKNNSGFTLIELMIVVAIIAIVAAVALPKLMSARLAANENAAIATLRSIAASQQQFHSACGVDTDADGGGEFGFFGELAGSDGLREYDAATGNPKVGAELLDPPFLATTFGDIATSLVERQGYMFKIYLPGATAASLTVGVAEAAGGGSDTTIPDSSNCEIYWCAYAWPKDRGKTGNRTFFINQEGDIVQTAGAVGAAGVDYQGTSSMPLFSAAYDTASMHDHIGLAVMSKTAVDANIWTAVGN